jgi:hypothetical protein
MFLQNVALLTKLHGVMFSLICFGWLHVNEMMRAVAAEGRLDRKC